MKNTTRKNKFTAVRYGNMLIALLLGIAFIPITIALMFGDEISRLILLICAIGALIGGSIWLRKVIISTFYRVTLSNEGVFVSCFGKRIAEILWEGCKCLSIHCFDTDYNLYHQYWLCFSTHQPPHRSLCKSLPQLPKQSNECIYMTYSEFAWEIIQRNLEKRIWKRGYNDAVNMFYGYDASSKPQIRQQITITMCGFGLVALCGTGLICDLSNGSLTGVRLIMCLIGLLVGVLFVIRFLGTKIELRSNDACFYSVLRGKRAVPYEQMECRALFDGQLVLIRAKLVNRLLLSSNRNVQLLVRRINEHRSKQLS